MTNCDSIHQDLKPEMELLICCARTSMDFQTGSRIRTLVRSGLDWPWLLRLALSHRMTPFLYRHLSALCPDTVPQTSLEHLREHFQKNASRNRFLLQEICKALRLFTEQGIRAVPLGGLMVGASLYPDLGLQELSNLTILVHRRDIAKATDLLIDQGYQPEFSLPRARHQSYFEFQSEHLLVRHDRKVYVEIGWQTGPDCLTFDLDTLWRWLGGDPLPGHELPTLVPEGLLLVASMLGALRRWEQLGRICVVAELINRRQKMNWTSILEQARSVGGERILLVGLLLANDLLGAALPSEISQRARDNRRVKRLAEEAREKILRPSGNSPGTLETFLFDLRASEGLADKIRCGFHRFMTPTAADWAVLPLPRSLSSLYYLVRPARLLGSHIGLLKRSARLDLAPFVPTPMEVVERMLALAKIGPEDTIYDLGCGDGRVVVAAAKLRGARGVGVDIDEQRIAESNANAREEGVEDRVTFLKADVQNVDVSPASVIFLYLNSGPSVELCSRLKAHLRPGVRIVLHDLGVLPGSEMSAWALVRTEVVSDSSGVPHKLHLWRVENASLGAVARQPVLSSSA